MMKRRILIIGYMILCILLLTACSNSEPEATTMMVSDGSEAAVVEPQEAVIGIFTSGENCDELVSYLIDEWGFVEKNIIIMNSENDGEVQKEQIKSYIDSSVDVVLVLPVSASDMAVITKTCNALNCPVIYLDYESEKEQIADHIIKYLNGEKIQ